MSFDNLAPHYRWMEWVLAGSKLQKCRTAFLHRLSTPQRVLLVGEGNGRFLVELCRVFPQASVTCVDASSVMLQASRKRLLANRFRPNRVEFVHADILEWAAPSGAFDLIVSHFFLDCFEAPQLERIVAKLAASATECGIWLLADFHQPGSGLKAWRAQWILKVMYSCFRWMTRLPASRLTPPDAYLEQQGFRLKERIFTEWDLLHSDCWSRSPGSGDVVSIHSEATP